MAHSYSQPYQTTCPHCGHEFFTEIYLIVDVAERPDLLARLRDGSLHAITCPHCGEPLGQVDAPLLVYRPGQTPPLTFSPARQTGQEQDQEHAAGLVGLLRERLGAAWRDDWLADGPGYVPRPLLALALSDDPEAAMRQAALEAQKALAELNDMEIHSPEDLERALNERPDLREKLARALGDNLQAEFDRLIQLQRQAEGQPHLWPAVVEGWERFLAHPAVAEGSPLRPPASGNLANACMSLYEVTGQEAWAQRAQLLFDDVLLHFTRSAHPQEWATVQHSLGNLYARRYERSGDEAQAAAAERHYRAALEAYRREAAPADWAMTQHSLGSLYVSRYERSGEEAQAEAAEGHYCAALEVRRREAAPAQWATVQHSLGVLYALCYERSGDETQAKKAVDACEQSLAIARDIGDRRSEGLTYNNLARIHLRQGDLDRALAFSQESLALLRASGAAEFGTAQNTYARVAYELGKEYIAQGRWYAAVDLLEQSLAVYRQGDDLNARAGVIYQLARVHALLGNVEKARVHYRDALRLYEHTQNEAGRAACKTGLGRLMIHLGFIDEAISELEEARQIYRDLGDEEQIAIVEDMLRVASGIKEKEIA